MLAVGVVTFTNCNICKQVGSLVLYSKIMVDDTGLTAIVFPIAVVGALVVVATVVVVVVAVTADKAIDSY